MAADNADPWDQLAAVFSGAFSPDTLAADAADNVLLAWPPLLAFLEDHVAAGERVLDFGCGGGWFAGELASRGFDVTGVDASAAMIARAEQHCGQRARFMTGDLDSVRDLGSVSAVTSVMTLQFLSDAGDAVRVLAERLHPGGALAIAVHNPEYVKTWLPLNSRYLGFDSHENPRVGFVSFGPYGTVPLHLHSAEEYDAFAQAAGLQPAMRVSPPFTEEFLRRYPPEPEAPTHVSEYLILGYTR